MDRAITAAGSWIVLLVASLWSISSYAQPDVRIALVIGNGAYNHADPLKNPTNDARAMAAVLRDAGFDVILRENTTRRAMTEALREFSSRLTPGGVGLFFYAGHGLQVRGANYLIPVDAAISAEDELKYEAIDVNDVLSRMDEARTRLSLVILDACRDNPFARRFRSTGRGLAQTDAPRGTVIAYATAPGDVAADGDGSNGLYTGELLKAVASPGLKLEEVFKRAIDGVAKASANKQTPWVSSSFRGDFYFHPPKAASAALPPPAAPAKEQPPSLWIAVAYDKATGAWGTGRSQGDRPSAMNYALSNCRRPGCEILSVEQAQCVAIAINKSPRVMGWGLGAETQAANNAMNGCRKSKGTDCSIEFVKCGP